jgi:hypothetical protein
MGKGATARILAILSNAFFKNQETIMTKTSTTETNSITNEFQNIPINDLRLINRLRITADTLGKRPEKSIPDACQSWEKTKATYEFFNNDKVTPAVILSSHRLNTIERMKAHPLALLIQDTSALDFTTHKDTTGLGPYATDPKTLGLLMHSVLAVSPEGVPLGLLYQNIWSRINYPSQKRTKRHKLPIEEKKSFKWLQALKDSLNDIPDGSNSYGC